jgi:GT2 family glycosyltransferase
MRCAVGLAKGELMDSRRFSIIVPVCHGGGFLEAALASLLALETPPEAFEVLVAADAADAEARRIVETAARRATASVRFVSHPSTNRAVLLNLACAHACGAWLVFTDDDCIAPPNWLTALKAAIENAPDAAVIGGSDAYRADGAAFGVALDWVLRSYVGGGGSRTPGVAAVGQYYPRLWNMAVRRDVALALTKTSPQDAPQADRPPVFDETLAVHEDVDLGERLKRAGLPLVFAPAVRVEHSRDTTPWSFLRRNFRMARVCRQKGIHRFAHWTLAGAMLGGAVLVVLAMALRGWWPAPALAAGAYLTVLLVSALAAARATRRAAMLFWVPLLAGGVHAARATGFLLAWPPRHREN